MYNHPYQPKTACHQTPIAIRFHRQVPTHTPLHGKSCRTTFQTRASLRSTLPPGQDAAVCHVWLVRQASKTPAEPKRILQSETTSPVRAIHGRRTYLFPNRLRILQTKVRYATASLSRLELWQGGCRTMLLGPGSFAPRSSFNVPNDISHSGT